MSCHTSSCCVMLWHSCHIIMSMSVILCHVIMSCHVFTKHTMMSFFNCATSFKATLRYEMLCHSYHIMSMPCHFMPRHHFISSHYIAHYVSSSILTHPTKLPCYDTPPYHLMSCYAIHTTLPSPCHEISCHAILSCHAISRHLFHVVIYSILSQVSWQNQNC